MASALLASSRNEPFWGEQKVYMRKNPNPSPRPVPENLVKDRSRATPGSSPFLDRFDLGARADEPPSAAYSAAPAISDDSSSFNHFKPSGLSKEQCYLQRLPRKEAGLGGEYISINIADYSRNELQDLKRRLVSELEQVRTLSGRIESGNLQIARSTGFSASGYGGCGGGGREVTSANASRQPPLILPQSALDSPPFTGPDRRMPESFSGRDSEDKHRKQSKRSLPLTSSREAKRQAITANSNVFGEMMKKCGQILLKLMKHKHGWVFNTPVDTVGLRLHDYYQIIKRPMDLGTVKSQLEKNAYSSPMEFAADVRLTFNNALLYNPEGHDVHVMAKMLLKLFEKLFAEASKTFDKQHAHVNGGREEKKKKSSARPQPPSLEEDPPAGRTSPAQASAFPPAGSGSAVPLLPAPTHVRSPSPAHPLAPNQPAALLPPKSQPAPPVTARPTMGKQSKKPKAKDPNKREMSFNEKKKLSLGLQNLPQEKMAQVLLIVQRRNADPALQGDEIELDFEVLDTETLWELDRFVCNCKKIMNKMKKQETMLAAAPQKNENTEKTENVPPATDTSTEPIAHDKKVKRGGETGDEDVDIGEDMPSSLFPPVEIEKDTGYRTDSSSSSSSSSDSSSSSGITTAAPSIHRAQPLLQAPLSHLLIPLIADSDSRSSSDSDSDADDAQSPAVV